ncbi:MAG: type II toxin-antitoxin system VapC family toxin [Pirellulaceae bacterium]|nr:type II toxin-antitoxin system VapC family toxin [Pirellulaceae bacterium]
MSDWCVDSAVVAKWVLPESDSSVARRVLVAVTASGGKLLVLDLAMIEVANAIRTRHHRKLLTLAEAHQALWLLQSAAVQVVPALPLLAAAFEIALQCNVADYDAMFVAVARQFAIGGVTSDEPLVRAVSAAFPEIKSLQTW